MKKATATATATSLLVDMKRNGRFTTINKGNFAIRPRDGDDGNDPEEQTYSPDLYIKDGFVLDESSPLKKFMNIGLIVESSSVPTKTGFTAHRFFRPLVDSMNYDENDNERHEALKPKKKSKPDPAISNENDCLKFGEAMGIAIRNGEMDYVIDHLQTDTTDPEVCLRENSDILFGEGVMKNQKLYKKAGPIDNDAIPEPGQSYAIVRRKSKRNEKGDTSADYHIAFVIYQEGGINITLEAEANAGREYLPHFAFYDTSPNGYTFHKRWAAHLPGDTTERMEALYSNGNTIVLQPTIKATEPLKTVGSKRKRGGKKSKRKITLRKKTMKYR